nr:TonB-dependent receptor [Sphingomonas bacterium]
MLQQLPASVAIVDLAGSTTGHISTGSRDVALSIEGLALTNLGPGRNRQFIRGVADSPFNGASQSTVAVQLDDTRVTFDAPDPDIRLVDIEQIEILKGPQGPLYGSGALGGIYHIVTRKPDSAAPAATVRAVAEAVEHGGPGGGFEAILNVPLVDDRLAIRGVGYVSREGGWIDNIGRSQNANATKVTGARLAARWHPDIDWTVDLSGVLQDVNTRDSQYVTSSDETVKRISTIAEPTDNDFRSVAATIQGRIGDFDVLGTTSYVDHRLDSTLDSTNVSGLFGLSGTSRFVDERKYTIVNHELRISPVASSRWLAGVSYLLAASRNVATIADGQRNLIAERLHRRVTEIAVFGEAIQPLTAGLSTSVGARLFRTVAEDEAGEQNGGASEHISKTVLSPSLTLSWTPSPRSVVYLRYARALRPGGLAPSGQSTSRRFDSDELGTTDLGFRHRNSSGRMSLSASLFHTSWSHIQSDYLLPNGLVSTRNAGRGRIYGAEANGEWRPLDKVLVSVGASYVDAHLVETEAGLELDDRRLPITPDLTARAVLQHRTTIGSWSTAVSVQANYIGRARLTFDPDLDRTMGGYATLSSTAQLARDRVTFSARIDNLVDIRGDSFAFGNPFSIMDGQQFTPLRPRTFTLSVARTW